MISFTNYYETILRPDLSQGQRMISFTNYHETILRPDLSQGQ